MLDNSSGYSSPWVYWADAARLQARVIAALLRRETRAHFGETRLGYLWAIIEPTLHLVVYAVLFTYILRRGNPLGGSLVLFMLTGLVPYFLYSKLASYIAAAIEGNRALLNLPPVKPLDVIISRAILEAATYLFVGFIMLVCIFLDGATDAIPYDPIELSVALAAIIAFGFGVGMLNAVIRLFIHNWINIFNLVSSPLFLLSGIWFLPEQVPAPYRDYILYNPMAHYIMWVRTGFYRGYNPTGLDIFYAMCCSISVVVLGLALLRIARRKILEPT